MADRADEQTGTLPGGVRGLSSMAMRHILDACVALWSARSERLVTVEATGGVEAARRVEAGEALDFTVLAPAALARLASAGRIDAPPIALARSDIALALPAGASPPDMTRADAIRDAVSGASRIALSTGPSGEHVLALLQRWGIGDRVVQAPPGVPVATLLARGDAEIAFQQLAELVDQPGIVLAGPLPPELQHTTVFAGAVCRTAQHPEDARTFLSFVASPATDEVKRRYGMAPP